MSNIPDPPTVNLADPVAAKAWASALRVQIDDAIAAGLDAAAPAAARMLGRRVARDHIAAAEKAIESLFAAAGLSDVGSRRSKLVRMMVDNAAGAARTIEGTS